MSICESWLEGTRLLSTQKRPAAPKQSKRQEQARGGGLQHQESEQEHWMFVTMLPNVVKSLIDLGFNESDMEKLSE